MYSAHAELALLGTLVYKPACRILPWLANCKSFCSILIQFKPAAAHMHMYIKSESVPKCIAKYAFKLTYNAVSGSLTQEEHQAQAIFPETRQILHTFTSDISPSESFQDCCPSDQSKHAWRYISAANLAAYAEIRRSWLWPMGSAALLVRPSLCSSYTIA